MEPSPQPPDLSRLSARADAPLAALGVLLEADGELDVLERMLLAWATHADGAGFARAWLLAWDARRQLLVGWAESSPAGEPGPANVVIGRARRAVPGARGAGASLPAWSGEPDALEPPLAEAWRSSGVAHGACPAGGSAPWSSGDSLGAVALRRGATPFGLIVGVWDGASPGRGGERLDALREIANVALQSQMRAAEARRRARQAAALAEFARSVTAAINLAEALHLLARLAAQGAGARGSAVWRVDERGAWRLEVVHGPAAQRERMAAALETVARSSGERQRVESGEQAPPGAPELLGEIRLWAAFPIVAYGRTLGACAVWDVDGRHPARGGLEPGDLEHLESLAGIAALLLEHARRIEELQRAEQQRADLRSRLESQEGLATLGELATRVAHESRNPLASIGAFARRAHKELPEHDPQREYLEIVLREAERLEAMMQEQLRYAALDRPRLKLQALNGIVQKALQGAGETLVRRRIRLLKKLAPDLPSLLLDSARLQRVVENVVAYALEAVPVGGRLRVESRRAGACVVVEIAHDGARQGGDLIEQLFVPFAASAAAGAAVGLGVAQQIVREHGGEIRVRSEGDWGTIFSFTLPILGNEDRRRGADRRGVRVERRRRPAED